MAKRTELTIFDGAESIGGTKAQIRYKETCLIFDFGMNFTDNSRFFTYNPDIDKYRWAYERHFKNLRELKILPSDISSADYFTKWVDSVSDLDNIPEPSISAIFLSHAHHDHLGCIKYLNPKIPLYLHPITYAFYCQKHIRLYIYKREEGIKNELANNELFRKIIPINHLEEVEISGFHITTHNVDHSIPGSLAYLIITPDEKKIVFTGDFRTHGILEERGYTEQFVKWLKDKGSIDLLITEGTNIDEYQTGMEEGGKDEWTVKRFLLQEIKDADSNKRMAIVNVSGNHISRLDTLFEIAQEVKKKLCISVYTATMLYRLKVSNQFKDSQSVVNHLKDLLIYERYEDEFVNRMVCTMDDISRLFKIDLSEEKALLSKPYQIISFDHFKDKQEQNILILWQGDLDYLPQISPKPKSKFIQSTWEPFTEEQQLDHNILLNWLKQYEMTYHHIHISGHTFAAQLKEIIKEIPAKRILPIHTLHPELFQDLSDKEALTLKNGESISI